MSSFAMSDMHHLVGKQDSSPSVRIAELIEQVHEFLTTSEDSTTTLKLIDNIQRLGLSHRFEQEIKKQLDSLSKTDDTSSPAQDLFTTALMFRLLRQNGYSTKSDVFERFMDEKKTWYLESLSSDTLGLLSLFEASCLGAKEEEILILAKEFSTTCLRRSLSQLPTSLGQEVSRALALPRHFRVPRLEARNYIEVYSKLVDCNSSLLELAKLEFNMVQMQHLDELTELKRWWEELGLVKKLGFGRDQPLEYFIFSVGIFQEPSHGTCRIELAKAITVGLVLDDVYDTYGQYDDLVLFTNAIKRWDLAAMTDLPEYLKICYMALYNTNNNIAYRILKDHGIDAVSYLRTTWIELIKSFMVEVEWFRTGYVPTPDEHMSIAAISGGTFLLLVHTFFLIGQSLTSETMEMMHSPYPNVFSSAGKVLRLWDDLGTSREEQEKGDVASSIQCYMRELNMTEVEAREHIKLHIKNLWTDINGALVAPKALPFAVVNAALNVARTAQVMYQHEDDNTLPSVQELVEALFLRPL